MRQRVRTATAQDTRAVARLIAESFAPIDLSRWLVPPDDERVHVLTSYFAMHVEHALQHGQIDVIDGPAAPVAAAVWFAVPHPDVPGYAGRRRIACGPWTERFERLEAQMHQAHPAATGPHMYGAFLAVEEHRQNRGLGSALLDQRLADMDQYGLPAYLEAANARSRDLYLRKGFIDCAPVFDLPYDGEPLYPMWRDGRHDASHTDAEPQADQEPQ
ncbi:GNAT family N-acetyltransferase [Dactylosporangium sp. CS-047395]|uniref:GNAT family N-acetyltransferase n=1 Tax=Dactylosporangium sp. CS-047395 TaxID=3239936 RepID=UPI003D8DEC71